MKICFLSDLRLPYDAKAAPYKVLSWAIEDMRQKNAELAVFAGELTAEGAEVDFPEALRSLPIPAVYFAADRTVSSLTNTAVSDSIRQLLEHVFPVIQKLPPADPDSAFGESPAIVYYDTHTGARGKAHFPCPVPRDFREYIGISCRQPMTDIPYAIEHRIRHIELRMGSAARHRQALPALISQWRRTGGQTVSIHAPDIVQSDRKTFRAAEWQEFTELAEAVAADRITLHIPNILLGMATDPCLDTHAASVAQALRALPQSLVIGIENMHMHPGEGTDAYRGFGYLPEECLRFAASLQRHTDKRVGTHLDVGHARNNDPYSRRHTLSTWYRGYGSMAVGYHIHQVLPTEHGLENHMPIDNWYGSLISYASFFREWSDGVLAKAPVFLEIRTDGGYAPTIALLERETGN